jgi:hypothetical protein
MIDANRDQGAPSSSRFCGARDLLNKVDGYISSSRLGYFFRLSGSGHVRNPNHFLGLS